MTGLRLVIAVAGTPNGRAAPKDCPNDLEK